MKCLVTKQNCEHSARAHTVCSSSAALFSFPRSLVLSLFPGVCFVVVGCNGGIFFNFRPFHLHKTKRLRVWAPRSHFANLRMSNNVFKHSLQRNVVLHVSGISIANGNEKWMMRAAFIVSCCSTHRLDCIVNVMRFMMVLCVQVLPHLKSEGGQKTHTTTCKRHALEKQTT